MPRRVRQYMEGFPSMLSDNPRILHDGERDCFLHTHAHIAESCADMGQIHLRNLWPSTACSQSELSLSAPSESVGSCGLLSFLSPLLALLFFLTSLSLLFFRETQQVHRPETSGCAWHPQCSSTNRTRTGCRRLIRPLTVCPDSGGALLPRCEVCLLPLPQRSLLRSDLLRPGLGKLRHPHCNPEKGLV